MCLLLAHWLSLFRFAEYAIQNQIWQCRDINEYIFIRLFGIYIYEPLCFTKYAQIVPQSLIPGSCPAQCIAEKGSYKYVRLIGRAMVKRRMICDSNKSNSNQQFTISYI